MIKMRMAPQTCSVSYSRPPLSRSLPCTAALPLSCAFESGLSSERIWRGWCYVPSDSLGNQRCQFRGTLVMLQRMCCSFCARPHPGERRASRGGWRKRCRPCQKRKSMRTQCLKLFRALAFTTKSRRAWRPLAALRPCPANQAS